MAGTRAVRSLVGLAQVDTNRLVWRARFKSRSSECSLHRYLNYRDEGNCAE